MGGRVILLNGTAAAGKTTLARRLQGALAGAWLLFGIDTFLWSLPPHLKRDADWLTFDDAVAVRGPRYRDAYDRFRRTVRTYLDDGLDAIVDEVFLEGATDERAWRAVLDGVPQLWVGVRCTPDEAERRNLARGDRMAELARKQAPLVHAGVTYDIEVDTEAMSPDEAAEIVVAAARERWSLARSDPAAPPDTPWRSPWPRADGSSGRAPWESN